MSHQSIHWKLFTTTVLVQHHVKEVFMEDGIEKIG